MGFQKILGQLNIVVNCKRYGVSLWQCPQFLFLIMGVVIIATALITYTLGARYVADPNIVSLIVLVLTIVLFIISFSITRSMEGLAEANRLKSEFVSIVSHQLRSPLSNLKWAIELLLSGRLGKVDEKHEEYLQILKDNTTRMGELIADLLTVSRIEQGRFPLEKSEFSLEDLTREIIDEFRPMTSVSKIDVKLEATDTLARVFADSSRIKIVVENLLDNALRYGKNQGMVAIKLKTRGRNLLFEITDTGVGIPKEDQRYIFERFFRSGNVLKHQTSGSGLGLYIAKFIIERSGGKIGFQSQENKGSTFWFTLPTKKSYEPR